MHLGFRAFLIALVCIPPVAAQQAANTPPEQRCVLAGRVTNALTGEPVKKANVRLMRSFTGGPPPDARASGNQGYSGSSDPDGNFRIENVEPGDYYLSGTRTGFLNTQYGAKKPMQAGTVLTLRPGQQMADVPLALTPQAVMTGKVVDADGDPVNGASVQVLAQQWFRGKIRYMPRNNTNTNDLGEYRLANLSPGKYYVSAQKGNNYVSPNGPEPPVSGKPDIRPVRTFYPGSTTFDSATAIDVKAGQDLSGMDIRMQSAQTYHVRGKVVGSLLETDRQNLSVSLSERNESFPMFLHNPGMVAKDRTFEIAGVTPGSYNLTAFVAEGKMRVMATEPVDVGAADVNDVVVTMVPPGSLTGVVKIEGTPQAGTPAANVQSAHVNLTPAEPMQMFFGGGNNQVASDGTFAIQNVTPGKFFVSVNAPPGTYVKAITFGQTDVNGKELDFGAGASGEIDVVLRYGTAEVDGNVQTASVATGDSSSIQSSVYLVPDPPNADESGIRFVNGGASFSIKNVPPGKYRAYAFESVEYGTMQNPDFQKEIESRGVEVEVKENEKKQIQLGLISADDLGQTLAKLGLDSR